jgi:hypothetical protein
MKIGSTLTFKNKKYLTAGLFVTLAVTAAVVVACGPAARLAASQEPPQEELIPIFDESEAAAEGVEIVEEVPVSTDSLSQPEPTPPAVDTLSSADSLLAPPVDSLRIDSLPPTRDSLRADSLRPARKPREKPFLEAPVGGKAQDSLVYDVGRRLIFHYNKGDLTYEDVELKADYIVVNAATKEIYATGVADTLGVMSRPEFVQGGSNYTMDTVRYNLDTQKALVQGVATKDGEGFLLGRRMKRMPDQTINIRQAKYTTCDLIEHPHFYIAMTKARVIPGKKIITGPAYFVMEDVPIYFLGLPGGFFPIHTGPTAGLVMPSYGEEASRGFYLRNLGYYFTFGDHFDLELTGDIYTLGSWAVNASSRYIVRYKFSGQVGINYQHLKLDNDTYGASNTFAIRWSHSQDAKANPGQTFSASVNYSTSSQKQLATTSLQDHLNSNTTSSISYSKNWTVGKTNVALTAAMNLSTMSRDSSLSVTLPNISLSVGKFSPFARKVQVGKQRWYEKISLSYSMSAQNSTGSVKEADFFTKRTLRNMTNGVTHSIPVSMSFNLLNYINFTPSFNYREAWNFQRQLQVWDPNRGQNGGAVTDENDPLYPKKEYGFFRSYAWDLSGSFSTKIYGMFESKNKNRWLQAIRHVLTPSFGFTYSPDFRHPRYGFVEHVQTNADGSYRAYNPNVGFGVMSPAEPRAAITFSLSNQLEIKVKSDSDSTGMKKVTILEQLAINGGSWNFLKDSMKLSNLSISLRTGEIFKGFAIQLNGQWTPYRFVDNGRGGVKQIKDYAIGGGKFGRITNTSWSFGKTFNSPNGNSPASGSLNSQFVDPYGPDPWDMSNGLDPALRRQYMVQGWYDFSVPWSFTFNYNINYQYTGLKPQITQTLGFNGSVTLTPKWGFNFNSGYDFTQRKLSHMQLSLTRDLHCWDMSFQWVPMGRTKSYMFHIGIKSGMLADIKYDKTSNMYDNLSY